ncbi:NADP-dependent oxidoreductase [Streptomyces sp. NBRC 109706]|uniref:NADP-dependent oxidoreductase n=1 Tax=Streptomyces sp. NBRC 109706 TaxID=1550035 RepID=UPI000782F34C|nr:NADP-dependent oxidoreductase [Streptomyces sp. NBRC 109706]
MKAFVIDRYRAAPREADVAEPVVGDHDVLIEVKSASVNQIDLRIAEGEFKQILPYRLPLVLGSDLAGVVLAVGPAVRSFAPGDEVFAKPDVRQLGTFAERVAVAEADLAIKPASASMTEAASLPLVALCAWQALVERGRVRPGQKVLIHAGAGGVGSLAIQLAKHLGATVATTVGAPQADRARERGADIVVDYRTEDFTDLLRDYDLVLDSLGGKNLEGSLRVLRPGGKAIGITGPPTPEFAREMDVSLVPRLAVRGISHRARRMARRLDVRYEFLFTHSSGEQLAKIAELVDGGALRPVVGQVFPFHRTPDALVALEKGGTHGKIVVNRE